VNCGENLREIAVAEIEERKRNGKKQVTISDAGISGIVRAVTRLTRQDIKGSLSGHLCECIYTGQEDVTTM